LNESPRHHHAARRRGINWWKEISTTRLNDPKNSSLVVVMQRLHEEDVSGTILSSEWSPDWTHLCIPAEYEWRRHCVTVLGWQDPRGLDDDGEPLVVVVQPSGERLPFGNKTAQLLGSNPATLAGIMLRELYEDMASRGGPSANLTTMVSV
jgi:hypothetical protein